MRWHWFIAIVSLLGSAFDIGDVHIEFVDLFGPPAEETTGPSEVTILGDANFTEYIKKEPSVLVLFYAPWCPFSKQMMPRYEDAARLLHDHDPAVRLARVDASANKEVRESENIESFPTLRLFLDGVPHEYSGGRHHRDLVKWVNDHLQTEFSVTSPEHLRKVMHAHLRDLLLLGSFKLETTKDNFIRASRHFDHVFFADTSSAEVIDTLLEEFEVPLTVKGEEFVVLFNPHAKNYPGEQRVTVLSQELADEDVLSHFIRRFMFPAVTRFSGATAAMIFESKLPVMLMVDSNVAGSYWPSNPSDALTRFRNVAEDFRGEILFVISADEDPSEKRLIAMLGMDDEALPSMRLFTVNPAGHHSWYPTLKFKPLGSVDSEEELTAFVHDYIDGRAKPYLKSQPLPDYKQWNTGEVLELVGSNFDDTVREGIREFFVKFHAPWCGHCRRMEPAFNELARNVASLPNLRIASVDATQNEVSQLHFDAYPALLFFRGNEKFKPLRYEGGRSADEMLEWIANNTRLPFDINSTKAASEKLLREREEKAMKRRPARFNLEEL